MVLTALNLTYVTTTAYSQTILLRYYIQDMFVDGRQIAKKRYIAKPNTHQMRTYLGMNHVYERIG